MEDSPRRTLRRGQLKKYLNVLETEMDLAEQLVEAISAACGILHDMRGADAETLWNNMARDLEEPGTTTQLLVYKILGTFNVVRLMAIKQHRHWLELYIKFHMKHADWPFDKGHVKDIIDKFGHYAIDAQFIQESLPRFDEENEEA